MKLENLKSELIVDDKIVLRLRNENEAQVTLDLINSCRPYLAKFLPWVDGTQTVEDCLGFIASCKKEFEARKACPYGVFYNSALVGIAGYRKISELNHSAEIGYWLAEQFQGKGIITRSVRTLINHGFDDLHLHRLQMQIATNNTSSTGVAKRLGFELEGIRKEASLLNGEYLDMQVFGIIN